MTSANPETKNISAATFLLSLMMILLGFFNARLFIVLYLPILFLMKRINKNRTCDNTFNIVDAGILIIAVYEFLSVFIPGHLDVNNQIKAAQGILCVSVLWFYLRLFVNQDRYLRTLSVIFSILAGILSVITIVFYVKHKLFVSQMGTDDMISFRAFYHPLGCISNDWCAILLCLLPMPVVGYIGSETTKQKLIHAFSYYAVILALLVSYSRGAYVVLLFFIVSLCLLSYILKCNYWKKVCLVTLVVALLASVTAICADRKSFVLTCQMSKTTVQKQSIEGRMTKWDESVDLFRLSPAFGFGSGNYGVSYDFFIKGKRNTITKRATNTYLQMLVEKGYVGSAVIVLSLLVILYGCVKAVLIDKRKLPLLLSLLALSLREVVFSSFYIDRRLPMLCVLILFLIIQSPVKNEE